MENTSTAPNWLKFLDEVFPDKTIQAKAQAIFGMDASFTRFLQACNIDPAARSRLHELYSIYQAATGALSKKEFVRLMTTLFSVKKVGGCTMVYGLASS